MVSAFEGNKAETKTMLPAIEAFMAAHDLLDVTVVADAGMISDANMPCRTGPKDKRRDQVIYYAYKADRAKRTPRGIDE